MTATPFRYPVPEDAENDILRVMTTQDGALKVMLAPQVCDGVDEWGRLVGVLVSQIVEANHVAGAAIMEGDKMRPMTKGEILEVVVGSMREFLADASPTEYSLEKIQADPP